jgi:hypothetical protein
MLLAIDTRERRVVADMVSKGVGGDDPLASLIEPSKYRAGHPAGDDLRQLCSHSSRFRGSGLHE